MCSWVDPTLKYVPSLILFLVSGSLIMYRHTAWPYHCVWLDPICKLKKVPYQSTLFKLIFYCCLYCLETIQFLEELRCLRVLLIADAVYLSTDTAWSTFD